MTALKERLEMLRTYLRHAEPPDADRQAEDVEQDDYQGLDRLSEDELRQLEALLSKSVGEDQAGDATGLTG